MNKKYKRIVVKVGTSTLTYPSGELHLRNMERLVAVLSDIKNSGAEVVLVSSGAISVGVSRLKMPYRPAELRLKQAAAAVGQCRLMHLYDKMFAEYNKIVAQILLTREDVDGGEREENLISTFNALLEQGAIPIVNENDSVSINEIQNVHGFGDNDTLSAVVAVLCE
ncbi:MAG: glutamate 5-kinase, partial [Oscillospiraceae bacterium]|nr:glutamate 5-kinase [Oscillospiraceae bacterium]